MIEGELVLSDRAGRPIGFTTVWLYSDAPFDGEIDVKCRVRVKPFYKTTK